MAAWYLWERKHPCERMFLEVEVVSANLTCTRSASRFLGPVFSVLSNVLRLARLCLAAKTGKRVQFPRCRATVSEKIAAGHWDESREGRLQETGCSDPQGSGILNRKA